MNLQYRISLLTRLGEYMQSGAEDWQLAKEKAGSENSWFILQFVEMAVKNIAQSFLSKEQLNEWLKRYNVPEENNPKTVGIVMAGNIPLVGFHDFLCVFISGNRALIKHSSKDEALIKHLAAKIVEWEPATTELIQFEERLPNCDAYIATGSNNSSRYFEYYFGRYPHIIRRNRTSVAILNGKETQEELENLADDVYVYFGLGCRNITKLYVPEGFDYVPLLAAFSKYNYLIDHAKYKNNFDYNLAINMLNNRYYMTNGSVLLIEEQSLFSPIGQLNYEIYKDEKDLQNSLVGRQDLQCISGQGHTPFGQAQCPIVSDYADGVDTMRFLLTL